MTTTTTRTRLAWSCIVIALVLAVHPADRASAQDSPVLDSAEQAAAVKAMEAAADSARSVAERRAARARQNEQPADSESAVSDSAAAEGAAKAASETAINAAKVLEALGDAAGKSVPDTSKAGTPVTAPADSIPTDSIPPQAETIPETPVDPTAPYKNVEFASDEKPRVVIETAMGKMVLELWPDVARKHCQNFIYQINQGFYDSLTVHRVVPGYLIQGGDPEGTGTGGPGYSVPAEFSTTHLHEEGTLSMARRVDPQSKTGAPEKPEYLNSAGSQFFICLARAASLDGKFTVFGKVVEGLDVLHNIEKTPTQRERPVAPVYMTKVYLQPKG